MMYESNRSSSIPPEIRKTQAPHNIHLAAHAFGLIFHMEPVKLRNLFLFVFNQWQRFCLNVFQYFSDSDECTQKTHQCVNAQCVNLPGTYNCTCKPGYHPNSHDAKECDGEYLHSCGRLTS